MVIKLSGQLYLWALQFNESVHSAFGVTQDFFYLHQKEILIAKI